MKIGEIYYITAIRREVVITKLVPNAVRAAVLASPRMAGSKDIVFDTPFGRKAVLGITDGPLSNECIKNAPLIGKLDITNFANMISDSTNRYDPILDQFLGRLLGELEELHMNSVRQDEMYK